MSTDPQNRARGIDVSKWQNNIDWPQLKASGLSFVYIKATEGTQITDPCFAKHWAGAKAVGLLRGAYLFYRCDQDPLQQAALFARAVGTDSGEMPPALDVEDAKAVVEAATRIQGVAVCLAELERLLSRRPIIYTAPYYWLNNLRDASGQSPAWAPRYALWEANYTTGKRPWLPPGWSDWTIWQYTDKGQVPGIAGNVDSDWFNGTPDDLLKWLGRPAATAPVLPAGQPPASGQTVTNQMMINAFSRAFGPMFWEDVVVRIGLTSIGIPSENRPKPYTGPAVDQIPKLTDDEQAKLKAALGGQV